VAAGLAEGSEVPSISWCTPEVSACRASAGGVNLEPVTAGGGTEGAEQVVENRREDEQFTDLLGSGEAPATGVRLDERLGERRLEVLGQGLEEDEQFNDVLGSLEDRGTEVEGGALGPRPSRGEAGAVSHFWSLP
jgi:hypothetical protein